MNKWVNGDTWVEREHFSNGGFTRQAFVKMPDGRNKMVKCALSDTYFSIPARARINNKTKKGYVMLENGVLTFTFEEGE